MPWCGYWGAASSAYGWVVPVIGLLFIGIMLFACSRGFGFGCMGRRRRTSDEIASLQREIDGLKADARGCGPRPGHEPSRDRLGNVAPGDSSAACCVPLRGKPIPR